MPNTGCPRRLNVPKALGALGKLLSHLLETAFSGSKCLVRKAFIYTVLGQTKKRSSKKGGLRHFLWGKKKKLSKTFQNLSEKRYTAENIFWQIRNELDTMYLKFLI